MKIQSGAIPSLQHLVLGVAGLLLAGGLIAAAMLWIPRVTGAAGSIADSGPPADGAPEVPAMNAPQLADVATRSTWRCAECGVVAATRELKSAGDGIDAGGGPMKIAQAGMQAASGKRYEVMVRMNDGSNRKFVAANPDHWRAGERVIVLDDPQRPEP
jgi:hypothetical protein